MSGDYAIIVLMVSLVLMLFSFLIFDSPLVFAIGFFGVAGGGIGTATLPHTPTPPYVPPAPELVQTVEGCNVYKVESRYNPTIYTTVCPRRTTTEWDTQRMEGRVYRTEHHRVEGVPE